MDRKEPYVHRPREQYNPQPDPLLSSNITSRWLRNEINDLPSLTKKQEQDKSIIRV